MAKTRLSVRQQCEAVVYRADVPRYTGRGPGGFEMHYNRGRCKRKATTEVIVVPARRYAESVREGGLCWQHDDSMVNVIRVDDV